MFGKTYRMLTKAGNDEAEIRTDRQEEKILCGGTLLEGGQQRNTDFRNYWLPRIRMSSVSICGLPCRVAEPNFQRNRETGANRSALWITLRNATDAFEEDYLYQVLPCDDVAQFGAFVFQLTDLK